MLFNNLIYFLEIFFVFLASIIIFYFSPIASIILLFVYSIWRNSFYNLIIISLFYDILFANFSLGPVGIPRMSLIVLVASAIVYYVKKLLKGTIRGRGDSFDF